MINITEYVVKNDSGNVTFDPVSTAEEVLQNVRCILSTAKYTVPLFREFGVSETCLDAPLPVAMSRLSAEITIAIQKYEPRAVVKKITFSGDGDGRLFPEAVISIGN